MKVLSDAHLEELGTGQVSVNVIATIQAIDTMLVFVFVLQSVSLILNCSSSPPT